jgi:uncharacterized protein (DUF2062 family)
VRAPTAAEQQRAARPGWRRRIRELLLVQLSQGITAEKISLTVALGLILSTFPILGTTTALCLLVGVCLGLNQPVMQLVNWVAFPLQLPGIYLYVRVGERLTGSAPVAFSITGMLQLFRAAPLQFLRQFGMTGLRAVLAWLLIAPLIAAVVYLALLPPLRRLARARSASAADVR